MDTRHDMWLLLSLVFSSVLFSHGQISNNISTVDYIIRDRAFDVLIGRRTSEVYDVPVPGNLSGMQALVMRLRSKTFWNMGANVSAVHIPLRTLPVPHVKRLVLVYQSWNNLSAYYYNVSGYELLSPVVSLLAYDASNTSSGSGSPMQLDLRAMGDQISISFPQVALLKGLNLSVKCVKLGLDGSMHVDDMTSSSFCTWTSTGHFTVVVPSEDSQHSSSAKKVKSRMILVIEILGGVFVLALLILMVTGIFKLSKKKRMKKMMKEAEQGEVLETAWIGKSRMPSAAMIRTQPMLETESTMR